MLLAVAVAVAVAGVQAGATATLLLLARPLQAHTPSYVAKGVLAAASGMGQDLAACVLRHVAEYRVERARAAVLQGACCMVGTIRLKGKTAGKPMAQACMAT